MLLTSVNRNAAFTRQFDQCLTQCANNVNSTLHNQPTATP